MIDTSTIKVLIAEDNDNNYLLIKTLLKGYNITRADDGQQAVDLASSGHYDIILMDIQMPVMDGLKATTIIRQHDAKTPIIAVTANSLDDYRKAAFDAGMNDFLTKPVLKTRLIEVITNLCSLETIH